MKNNFYKKEKRKALSPLIATILLIVVAVVIIGIVVSWGKGFTTDNLNTSEKIKVFSESDVSFYINVLSSMNGRTVIEYKPPINSPFRDLNIIGYGIVGLTTHVVPFDSFQIIEPNHSANIDHGVILSEIDLLLYLDNDTVITKKKIRQEIKQPSSCPEGYIPVPGNHLYETMNKDGGFCVAKWEMKVDQNNDGIGDVNVTCKGANYIWNNKLSGCEVTNFNIVSSSQGYPIAQISKTESSAACQAIGGHLITNNEWMTIVRNIELVKENWTGEEIGSGGIYMGNLTSCDNLPSACYNSSIDPDYGLEEDRNTFARLKLTNNQYIWDLSGNLWEITASSINLETSRPLSFNSLGEITTAEAWFNYSYKEGDPEGEDAGNHILWNNLGETSGFKYKDLFLISSGNYNASQGIGRIDLFNYPVGIIIRGGDYIKNSFAGVLSMYISNSPNNWSTTYGFRCVK